jgi:dTDP-4-dehydrorhamnose 3,5-epimerase-like enzyme
MKKYHIHILKKHKKSVVLKGNIFIALYQLLKNDNTTTTIQISDLYSRKNK